MGTWYAIEWWFLQRLTRGKRVICWYTGFTLQLYKKIQMESFAFMFSLKISVTTFFEDQTSCKNCYRQLWSCFIYNQYTQ